MSSFVSILANAAFGFATKKFAASPWVLGYYGKYRLKARVAAIVPTLLLSIVADEGLCWQSHLQLTSPLKSFARIGNGTVPGAAPGANVHAGWPVCPHSGLAALKAARFARALRNSCKKPFSKILTSLKSFPRHTFTAWFPT
jgi:hypothetical protein